ncbi:hypothetical protein [Syntrophomonas erecta]
MRRLVNQVEKFLFRAIVIGLVALVVVQGFMTRDSMRLFLSWGERMEGQQIEYPAAGKVSPPESGLEFDSPHAVLTISMDKFSSLPRAEVLVNGEKRTVFNEREVTLQLMAGDVVEIDSTSYNFPVEYRISKSSDNLSFPEKGKTFTADQSIVMIGKIIVK